MKEIKSSIAQAGANSAEFSRDRKVFKTCFFSFHMVYKHRLGGSWKLKPVLKRPNDTLEAQMTRMSNILNKLTK